MCGRWLYDGWPAHDNRTPFFAGAALARAGSLALWVAGFIFLGLPLVFFNRHILTRYPIFYVLISALVGVGQFYRKRSSFNELSVCAGAAIAYINDFLAPFPCDGDTN